MEDNQKNNDQTTDNISTTNIAPSEVDIEDVSNVQQPVEDKNTIPEEIKNDNNLNTATPTIEEVGTKNYIKQMDFSVPVQELTPEDNEILTMPTTSIGDITNTINSINNNLEQSKRDWFATVASGVQYNTFDDGLIKTTRNKLAEFSQLVESEAGKLGIVYPKFKDKENTTYTGEAALMRIRGGLGMGTAVTVPLWHSGFWITIKTPKDGALLELYRRLSADKIKLGRSTYGLLLSNTTVYTTETITDFILENIHSTSLAVKDIRELRKYIKVQDIPVLIWGLACAIWHKGFQYNRACTTDHTQCTHVIKELIDLTKIHWTDKKSLTPKQINHMTRRTPASMSIQDIDNYQFDFANNGEKQIKLSEDISIVIKTPNLEEHIVSGDEWVSTLEEKYPESLILKEDEREEFLFNQARSSSIRQYSHFIKKIIYKDDEHTEQTFINEVLDEISSDDNIRNLIIKECSSYIDDTTISIIAIPTFKCPNCGSEQTPNKDIGMFSSLIPLDTMNAFFILLVQKIQRIETR